MKTVFAGLGRMGAPMAKRLVSGGHSLSVWSRSPEKSRPFAELKADVCPDLASALAGADIVFTMLSDDAALRAVINRETAPLLAPGAIHVSHSTVSPAAAGEAAALLAEGGRSHLSAPVMGRPDAAAAGSLRLLLSGPAKAKERILPLIGPLGEAFDFGEDPASALQVKLAFNFLLSSLIESLSEAFSFVEKNSVSPENFFVLISETLFSAPAVKTYGALILRGGFGEAGFLTALGRKDLALLTDQAALSLTPMPLATVLEGRFTRALNRGWAERDWCVVSELQREDAGLPPKIK
jgi:3-hydroxyisobutyrate dehydrogenase-like beta-hydroxyacid dehydrogenase